MINAVVLSYKPIDNDTRVNNQIKCLEEFGINVEVVFVAKTSYHNLNARKFILYLVSFINLNDFTKYLWNIKSKLQNYYFYYFKKFFWLNKIIKILFYPIFFLSKFFMGFFHIILNFFIKFFQIILNFFIEIFFLNEFSKNLMKYIYVFFQLKKKFNNNSVRIVIANDLLTLPFGVFLKIKNRCNLIYDMHEYELHRIPSPNFFKKISLIIIEEFFIPFSDVIFTVSYNIKKKYKKRFPHKKISLVLNAPSAESMELTQKKLSPSQKINFIHVGNISYGRNIEEIIDYFSHSKHSITFLGEINDGFNYEYNFLQKINKFSNIFYLSPVLPHKVFEVTKKYDCGLFLYNTKIQNYNFALPNKFLLSLIHNTPIICFKSKELTDFEKRFNVKLNLINKIEDIDNLEIRYPKISQKNRYFFTFQRQKRVVHKYLNIFLNK